MRRLYLGAAVLGAVALGGLSLAACGDRMVEGSIARMHAHADDLGLVKKQLQVGPASVSYRVGGRGPALLLVHGFGGDGVSTWLRQLEPLLATHTVIVPDLLWFGESASEGPRTLAHQAEALEGVLEAEGVSSFSVMGVSYGGFLAMELTQRQLERIDKLLIVDSPGGVFSDEDISAMARRFGGETAADVFVPTDGAGAKVLLDLCFVDPPKLPGFVYDDIYEQTFSQHHAEHAELLEDLPTQREDFFAFDWSQAPEMLIVWGELDPVFPLSEGRELAEVTGGELVVIPQTAHGPNFEEPERFNEIVAGFLSGG